METIMNAINTLIKWPGGKTREIKYIEDLIPSFDRYVEPFFGGGAMFFYLKPETAIINDISVDLMSFYSLVKEQDCNFKKHLEDYSLLFNNLQEKCDAYYSEINTIYHNIKIGDNSKAELDLMNTIKSIVAELRPEVLESLRIDIVEYINQLYINALDKMQRTIKNEIKAPFSVEDLKENLITGFTSGTYMYFRNVYNAFLLGKKQNYSKSFRMANFYFIREYCYGSMFRYNSRGEFNIPYGGMSYNKKDFKSKIDEIFNEETKNLFAGTELYCMDFDDFFSTVSLTEQDFMFLDPPYDTDFSDYEGKDFTQEDQKRLANALKKTKAKFILIIKNTEFIYSLYAKDFNIFCFDKTYTYNVRSRNDRNVEHLIITNISTE